MSTSSSRTGVIAGSIRNYWLSTSLGGFYFVLGFVFWGGTRGAIVSSAIFVVFGLAGLAAHYAVEWRRRARIRMVIGHLMIGEAILVWQKAHLPLSDFTATGNPDVRDTLIYLVSALIVGTMSMFGGPWGVVLGLATHYAFIFNTHAEVNFMWAFPVLIALAGNIVSAASWRLETAYEQMELLADHDNLTGLLNRRRLAQEFERLKGAARESGRALVLIAWDLDDLKTVNDTQGHAAGDAYISAFAKALQANLRRTTDERAGDAAFRVGGDEFISMHLDVPDGGAVRARVYQAFPTVSAGSVRCDELTLDQALTRADAALYVEKASRKMPSRGAAGGA